MQAVRCKTTTYVQAIFDVEPVDIYATVDGVRNKWVVGTLELWV